MSLKMFQILVSALLFTALCNQGAYNQDSTCKTRTRASVSSVLGAPFLTEESANQFIRLKRHILYSPSYWDSGSSQTTWGSTVAEQISETWASLRETAQYYMDLDPFAFNPSIATYDGVSQQSIS